MRAVRVGGSIALIGILSGVSAEVNPLPVLMKSIRVQGIFVGSRSMFEAMNRAIAASQLHPLVDRIFDFDQAPGAQISGKRRSLRQDRDSDIGIVQFSQGGPATANLPGKTTTCSGATASVKLWPSRTWCD